MNQTLADNAAPAAADPGVKVPAQPCAPGATRLHHLFRASLRDGPVHPLLRVVQAYRAQATQGGGTQQAAPHATHHAAPPRPSASTGAESATLRSLDPEQVRRRVAELPPLPEAALRALRTLRREDASLADMAADLSCDASLTALVLRLANSPFYGVTGRVSSARDAAQLLGRRTLESVLSLAAVAGQFKGQRNQPFGVSTFWRHALASAIAARGLARAARLDDDQAFLAGLLHDIGLLAMSVYFPDELQALVQRACADDVDICTVEHRHGVTTHAVVGSWIAAHWHFPGPVVQAIAAHHAPTAQAGAAEGIAACVHVADAVAHALDIANLEHEFVPMVDGPAWQRIALADEAFCSLFDETETGVRSLCAALGL